MNGASFESLKLFIQNICKNKMKTIMEYLNEFKDKRLSQALFDLKTDKLNLYGALQRFVKVLARKLIWKT